MLDYTDHVSFCPKLKDTLEQQKEWLDICRIQSKNLSVFACLCMYPLTSLTLFTNRKCKEPESPMSTADKGASESPPLESLSFHQLPSSSSQAQRLSLLQRVRCPQQGQYVKTHLQPCITDIVGTKFKSVFIKNVLKSFCYYSNCHSCYCFFCF